MSTPTHLLGGYAILTLTQPLWGQGLPPANLNTFLLLGVLFSVLIDLDVLWAPGFLKNHHQQFTHWPLTWISFAAVLTLVGLFTPIPILLNLALVFLIAACFHLFLDLFGITLGIPLLAPFTRREFALTRLAPSFTDNRSRTSHFLSHPWIFYREILVSALGVVVFLHR